MANFDSKTFPIIRRESMLTLWPELLVEMAKGTDARLVRCVGNQLPDDARVERCVIDQSSGLLKVLLSSPSFEPVPLDQFAPVLASPKFEVVAAPALADEARARADEIDSEWGMAPGEAPHADAALLRKLAEALTPQPMRKTT